MTTKQYCVRQEGGKWAEGEEKEEMGQKEKSSKNLFRDRLAIRQQLLQKPLI
jgi:hypothetical protein